MRISFQIDDAATPALKQLSTASLPMARREFVRQLSLSAIESIVEQTPVQTGRASASWVSGLNQLGGQGVLRGSDPAAIAEGRSQGSASLSDSTEATSAQVSSSVDYIAFLEYGTRRMAPIAMVRRALASARSLAASLFTLTGPRPTGNPSTRSR